MLFYRLCCGRGPDLAPKYADLAAVFNTIHALNGDERYGTFDNDSVLMCTMHRRQPPFQLEFARVRRSDLPQVESGGRVKRLPILDGEGIYDAIHAVFFANGIVGAEFNFYGPRAVRLPDFIMEKASAHLDGLPAPLTLEPLLRDDPRALLDGIAELRAVDIKISRAYAAELAQARSDDVISAMEKIAEFGGAQTVEIRISAGRKRDATLTQRMRRTVQTLISRKDFREVAERLKVTGRVDPEGPVELFDLLADRFIADTRMVAVDGKSRTVSAASAYSEIGGAYAKLRGELTQAASVRIS